MAARSGAALTLALCFCLAAGAPAAERKPPADFPISFGGPFELVDHDGRRRTDRDFRGAFLLVFFGYTHCPDICPTGLQTMADALDLLGPLGKRVRPVFITVDPARDTPAQLKDYVASFHPRLIGLTGTEGRIAAAARAYKLHRFKVPARGGAADEYLVSHSSITYLMGPDGKFVTLFPHGVKPEFMAKAMRKYLAAGAAETGGRRER